MGGFDWAYSGVNPKIPRNTGPECASYLSPSWRQKETVIILLFSAILIIWGYLNLSPSLPTRYLRTERGGKRLLLIIMSLIWGMEIGFKFASRTVIYILNPCHITTAIQIYLLAAPPSSKVTALFRIHLNYMNGPLLAFIFPETESRMIPLEAAIYWIQHFLMLVVPYYLLRLGGVYNMEPLSDMSWNSFSYGLILVYHYVILQAFAIPSQVNLNHMLCPALLDPFQGPYYRLIACFHQALLCPLLCKLFYVSANYLLTKFSYTKVKPQLENDLTITYLKEKGAGDSICVCQADEKFQKNGGAHMD